MKTGKKSSYWRLQVKTESTYKVAFDRELTGEEAVEAFNNGDFEDVLDTDAEDEVAVGFDE